MDPAAPQSRLLVGWQPNLQRMLSDVVPLLSMEVRATFREFVKDLRAKKDAREIPSLSAALMEQAPQVVGAYLWQQCIDRQREAAVRQAAALSALKVSQLKEKCRTAGLPVGGTKPVLILRLQAATTPAAVPVPAAPAPAAARSPAPPTREAGVIDCTLSSDDEAAPAPAPAPDDNQNLAPRRTRGGNKMVKAAVASKRKALEERDAARAEAKRAKAGKGVAVLSTVSECHKRIDQLERRLTKVSDYCIELGADPDDVNELRYGPI